MEDEAILQGRIELLRKQGDALNANIIVAIDKFYKDWIGGQGSRNMWPRIGVIQDHERRLDSFIRLLKEEDVKRLSDAINEWKKQADEAKSNGKRAVADAPQ